MKKNTLTIRIFGALALALVVAACTENETQLPESPAPEAETITFIANLGGSGGTTRLSHTDPTDAGVKVSWTEEDELTLFDSDYSDAIGIYTVVEGSITNDGKTATFSGPALPSDLCFLYGPAHKIPTDDSGFDFLFSFLGQKQTGNNNMAHLKDYDLIEGYILNYVVDNITFTHKSCLLQFDLTDLPQGTYTNFSIKSNAADGGIMYSFNNSGDVLYTGEFPLELDNIALDGSETLTLWVMMPVRSYSDPVFKAGNLTLEVTDNGGTTYTNATPIILAGDKAYEYGKRYYMTTAMQGGQ